ncbi:transcriptional regulator [Streptomyces armeniacus]|uniref:Transcriptional regulator n=1 Tax=Streptomyces armeniacus TaxID=83291 RepID=A0A345XV54_9ACTN|nr:metalloregulator ArsR/SmtB family transcription factor [Streptomyces armeniacus]AXK35520.1 transcriptional regulator [Streptomyces armeniacus]
MKDPHHPAPGEITLPRVLAALSDPIRLGVVRLLADGRERGWGELRAPVAKSTLSHHMKVLRDAGLTRTRQEGTRCYVELRRADLDARFPDLMGTLLAVAGAEGVGGDVTAGGTGTGGAGGTAGAAGSC